MLEKEKLKLKAKFFRGCADPTGLAILECLRNGEKTVTEIVQEIGQSQSNVSNHLSCLLECGLLKNCMDVWNWHNPDNRIIINEDIRRNVMFNSYVSNTLKYDPGLCINCGMCSTVCPHGVFSLMERLPDW